MPKVDLTVTISVILAACAIIVPMLTTIISNLFQIRIKKLELKQLHYEKNVLYQKEIFENYLRYASQCTFIPKTEHIQTFAEYHFLAYLYAPDELHNEMSELRTFITKFEKDKAAELLEELTPQIRILIKKL